MAKKRISLYIERRLLRLRMDFDDSLMNNRIGLERSFCSIEVTISRITLRSKKNRTGLYRFIRIHKNLDVIEIIGGEKNPKLFTDTFYYQINR